MSDAQNQTALTEARVQIDDGIPLPTTARGAKPIYPLAELEVGQSFFVASDPPEMQGQHQRRMSALVVGHSRRNGGKFATRRVTQDGVKGVRVWRVA